MQIRNTPDRYGVVAQGLHWLIVGLILVQFVLAGIFDDMPRSLEKAAWIVRRKTVGMTVLMLAVVRRGWRWANPVPAPTGGLKRWERGAARATRRLLYGLIVLIPLSGWLMSSAAGVPVGYLDWFEFPALIEPRVAWVDPGEQVHEILAAALAVVAGVHAAAALKHHFLDRDTVLLRMLPRGPRKSVKESG